MFGLIADILVRLWTKHKKINDVHWRTRHKWVSGRCSVLPTLDDAPHRTHLASCVCFSTDITQGFDHEITVGTPLRLCLGGSQQAVELPDRNWPASHWPPHPVSAQEDTAGDQARSRPNPPSSTCLTAGVQLREMKINWLWTRVDAAGSRKKKTKCSRSKDNWSKF